MSKPKTGKTTKKVGVEKKSSVMAKSDDGTIQINLTLPYSKVKKAQDQAGQEMAKEITLPGFRKGKAPLDRVLASIPRETLIEKGLNKILPELISQAFQEHQIKPITSPKVELIKAQEGGDWQIRVTTCELPEVKLGDYQKQISGAARASLLWTPDKAKKAGEKGKEKAKLSLEEKQQLVLKTLLEEIKIKIPRFLIEQEVNQRLAQLLARIERLGLSLESYLASTGKTVDQLREEYARQAEEGLKIELILNAIAEKEKVKIQSQAVDQALKTSGVDPDKAGEDQKRMVESILTRRAALDSLTNLIAG